MYHPLAVLLFFQLTTNHSVQGDLDLEIKADFQKVCYLHLHNLYSVSLYHHDYYSDWIFTLFLDVNECVQFSDLCKNGRCRNTIGSFLCTCNQGYALDDYGTNCLGESCI